MRHPIAIWLAGWLTCLAAFSFSIFAQVDAQPTVHDAIVLERRGGFAEAIRIVRNVTESKELTGVALGRAYIVLGTAYRHTGNFPAAKEAFEQSFRILAHDTEHAGDYASALDNYAVLYNDSGQVAAAISMWKTALRLQLQIGDHTGAMLSLVDLAGAALSRHRADAASKYLNQAVEEKKLTVNDVTDEGELLLLETQGWLALLQKRSAVALANSKQALEISIQIYGEKHWLTGWEHMLLGKAYVEAGDLNRALWHAQEGLKIIEQGAGTKSPEYFAGEIAYAQMLDRTGAHLAAARFRADAEQGRKDFYGSNCAGCTIAAVGLR